MPKAKTGKLHHLIGIRDSRHATHDSEHVVVHGVHTHLGSGRAGNRARGEHKLEDGIVNAREVARTTRLVFLRAESE